MNKFISCDWGTSNLRLRLVDGDNRSVLKEMETSEGIASVHQSWKDQRREPIVMYVTCLFLKNISIHGKMKMARA